MRSTMRCKSGPPRKQPARPRALAKGNRNGGPLGSPALASPVRLCCQARPVEVIIQDFGGRRRGVIPAAPLLDEDYHSYLWIVVRREPCEPAMCLILTVGQLAPKLCRARLACHIYPVHGRVFGHTVCYRLTHALAHHLQVLIVYPHGGAHLGVLRLQYVSVAVLHLLADVGRQ